MRRGGRVLLGLVVLVSATTALAVTAGPAAAGRPPRVTVTKVVEGPAPPGAQYVVDVDCEGADIQPSSQLTFTGSGSQTVEVMDSGVTCTVTETATSGAAVSYGCEITSNAGGSDSACTGGNTVFFETGAVDATITVTNDFRPPPEPAAAAEPIEAVARFTG
jgi:Domain of unknown function (DUF5979)